MVQAEFADMLLAYVQSNQRAQADIECASRNTLKPSEQTLVREAISGKAAQAISEAEPYKKLAHYFRDEVNRKYDLKYLLDYADGKLPPDEEARAPPSFATLRAGADTLTAPHPAVRIQGRRRYWYLRLFIERRRGTKITERPERDLRCIADIYCFSPADILRYRGTGATVIEALNDVLGVRGLPRLEQVVR